MNEIAQKILAKVSEATPREKGYVADGDHYKYRYRITVPNNDTIALDAQIDTLADKILKKRKKTIKDRAKVYFDHFSITINNNEEDSEITINDHYIVEKTPNDGILEEDENLDIKTKING